MREGWLLDENELHPRETKWLAGAPETGWLGTMKFDKEAAISVKAFRCASCGFLELYANN